MFSLVLVARSEPTRVLVFGLCNCIPMQSDTESRDIFLGGKDEESEAWHCWVIEQRSDFLST